MIRPTDLADDAPNEADFYEGEIGAMLYQDCEVRVWYYRAVNYGDLLQRCWDVLQKHGHTLDGKSKMTMDQQLDRILGER